MKKRLFLPFLALGLCIFSANATDITASVNTNTTWTSAGSPYIIVNNIDVSPNVTLTIENGVEVKFNSGRYMHVRGTLNATGVKFTGNAGVTKGFWDGIYVSYEYYENGNVNLTNCTYEYASHLYVRKGQLT
jgi:nitrate reductase beta subunit